MSASEDDLIYRLRKRAEIRRQATTRKSVQEGKPDRISDLLEESANEIENLRKQVDALKTTFEMEGIGMVDRFELEQQIMSCWSVVDDVKALNHQVLDVGNMTTDQISNYLLGLETIYQVKFEQMFATFEQMITQGKIK
jgi:hypothetical protein